MPQRPRKQGSGQAPDDGPLKEALVYSGLGFPAEVWAIVATVLAPAGVTYTVAYVEDYAARHSGAVHRIDTARERLFSLGDDPRSQQVQMLLTESSVVQGLDKLLSPGRRVEDDIAVALVTRYAAAVREHEQDLADYLRRCLPAWCADGTGAGIEALRNLPAGADTDGLLGQALMKRSNREESMTALGMCGEAHELFTRTGQPAEAAEAMRGVADLLLAWGDDKRTLGALYIVEETYRGLAARNDFYERFLARTLLDIGHLHRDVGHRAQAVRATREAYQLFQRIAAEDHRFVDEMVEAGRQLRGLRWPRRLGRR